MKKITLALVIFFHAVLANAQINKGTWMVSSTSNFGFNSYSVKSVSSNPSVLLIGKKAGYFVANNFAIGANLSYMSISSGGSGSSTSVTTYGLFTRGFLGKGIFLGAGLNSSTLSSSGSQSYTLFPIEFGYAGFVGKSFAIEPSLNYVVSSDSEKGGAPLLGIPSQASSSIGLNVAFTFYLSRGEAK